MATKKTDVVDQDQEVEERVEQLPAGTLVLHADDPRRVALLAGYTDDGHPLVVDLPPAREHHPGVVRA